MFRFIPIAIAALVLAALGGFAQAAPIVFTANLSGPQENPPADSPGTGSATVIFDADAHSMSIDVSFEGLLAPTIAAHIHGPVTVPDGTAGVATQVPSFVDFPLGVNSGSYSNVFNTLDPATYNPAFVTANGGTVEGAEAAFLAMLLDGTAYLNIHSEQFPSGEIRGFLIQQTAVSAPPAAALFTLAVIMLGARGRRARR